MSETTVNLSPAEPTAADPLIKASNLNFELRTTSVRKAKSVASRSLFATILGTIKSSASIHKRTILKDLDFTIQAGDRVGLIGPNGAGKSTLLFVLNGALYVDPASLSINGTTHALMNVRLGMRPNATGTENIFLNGYRLGFDTEKIRSLVDEIIDFSELGNKIDEPMHTYSAGMQLRLAFAIATSVKPDILLMDEWVGAGDRRFRQKASDRLNNVLQHSRAMVIASHNENLIRATCNKVLLLNNGSIEFFGGVDEGYEIFNKNSET